MSSSNIFLDSVKDDPLTSLNNTSDLTRMAYSTKSSDIPLRNNSMTDRFESDTFINNKEITFMIYNNPSIFILCSPNCKSLIKYNHERQQFIQLLLKYKLLTPEFKKMIHLLDSKFISSEKTNVLTS